MKNTILVAGLLIVGLSSAPGVMAQAIPTSNYLSRSIIFQRVLTGKDPLTTSVAPFVQFVATSIPVPPGATVLLTARFSAESRCTETSSSDNWCEMRILIGGTEAEPAETASGQDVAFDGTDRGTATSGNYETHSMERHRCYTNSSGTPQQVPVVVEWGVTNLDGGGAPLFWIDDWSLVVQEGQGCTQS